MHVEVRTISDRLAEMVRDMILSGAIDPGESIRQDVLAAQMNVSKIPLREALGRLEQFGLVTSHPNRGFFVSSLSAEEAEEVFALRLKLEPQAAALAAANATEAERQLAIDALNRLEADIAAHRSSVGASNREFHLALVRPCHQKLTFDIIARLNYLADRYVRKHLEPRGRDRRAGQEHQDILKAWLAKDGAAVKKLTTSHLQTTLSDLRVELNAADAKAVPAAPTKGRRK